MPSDYKEAIQQIFEELCVERFATDKYWTLTDDTQYELYTEATRLYTDRMADRADYLRKAERER